MKPGVNNMRFSLLVTLMLLCSVGLYAESADLNTYAADYISTKAKETGKSRIALYPVTDEEGETTPETQSLTTRIMELVIKNGGLRVIAPDHVSKVLDEQEKGMSGLVDAESAPDTGKLLGADTLVFPTCGPSSIQVRMIDAVTGEVIGATVSGEGKAPSVQNDDMTKQGARDDFQFRQLRRHLKQNYKERPVVYLYETSTDDELKEMQKSHPALMKKIEVRLKNNPEKERRINRTRSIVAELRKKNKSFDQRIRQSRAALIRDLKDRKNRHKHDDD